MQEEKSNTSNDFLYGPKYILHKDIGLLEQTNFNRGVFYDIDAFLFKKFKNGKSLTENVCEYDVTPIEFKVTAHIILADYILIVLGKLFMES